MKTKDKVIVRESSPVEIDIKSHLLSCWDNSIVKGVSLVDWRE